MDAAPLIYKINSVIINPIISFLFVAAFFLFLWGLFQFLWRIDDEEANKAGKQHMLWGVVGLFIMVGVFGIMRLILDSFGIAPEQSLIEVLPRLRN